MKKFCFRCEWALVCGAILFFTSCTTFKYAYGDKQYSSAADALAAQQQADAALIAQIRPAAQSLNATLAVIIPTDDYIAANWVTRKGKVRDELVDYVVKALKNEVVTKVEALKKRRLFGAVVLRQSTNVEAESFSEDLALWVPAKPKIEWWLKANGEAGNSPLPIETPAASLSRLQQMTIWLDKVEAVARKFRQ